MYGRIAFAVACAAGMAWPALAQDGHPIDELVRRVQDNDADVLDPIDRIARLRERPAVSHLGDRAPFGVDQVALPVPVGPDRPAATHDLGAVPPAVFDAADARFERRFGRVTPGPLRASVTRRFDEPLKAGDALVHDLGDGRSLWSLEVRSPGALGLRLRLQDVELGDGRLVIYAPTDDGPVVRDPAGAPAGGWTRLLPGDSVRIEFTGRVAPKFSITGVSHFDHEAVAGGPVQGGALGCHMDVSCVSAVHPVARDATGVLCFEVDDDLFSCFCSGTLLNDQDSATLVPYFITAYHCISSQSAINSLEVFWLWQSSSCNGSVPALTTLNSNLGGALLETNDTDSGNDMTFIRLNGALQPGVGLAGWTTASLGDNAYGVHHPAGTFKRGTLMDTGSGVCFDITDYDYYEIESGAIEGGSSGSGIFNPSAQLSGQLYGWCGHSEDPGCSDQVGSTLMYGEFESSYYDANLAFWLALGGTINVDHTNTSAPWTGAPADPFRTVSDGNNLAWSGARLRIRGGSYDEALTLNTPMEVVTWGGTVTIGQ